MAVESGTELFSKQLNGALAYADREGFPTTLVPMKTYYGDTDGASEQPTDKNFLSGERIGITTGETKLIGNKLYYKLRAVGREREKGGFLGWGGGVYKPIELFAWVVSTDVTDDKVEADKLLNERLNAKQVAKDKATQKVLDAIEDENDNSLNGGLNNGYSLNVVKILLIALGFVAVIIAGVLFWKSKNKETSTSQQLAGARVKQKNNGIFKKQWKQFFGK